MSFKTTGLIASQKHSTNLDSDYLCIVLKYYIVVVDLLLKTDSIICAHKSIICTYKFKKDNNKACLFVGSVEYNSLSLLYHSVKKKLIFFYTDCSTEHDVFSKKLMSVTF